MKKTAIEIYNRFILTFGLRILICKWNFNLIPAYRLVIQMVNFPGVLKNPVRTGQN